MKKIAILFVVFFCSVSLWAQTIEDDATWKLKRQTGKSVSTNNIDNLYDKGITAGALGGKLLGAGGGGFLVFYVQPEKQMLVKEAMKDLLYIPFKFEDGGTQVIYYGPEDYSPLEDK